MYIGLDIETNELVSIDESDKTKKYICPHCKSKLIKKCGDHNMHHFAHESLIDCDSWSHEMSEWHKNWQNKFPVRFREIEVVHNSIKHRADILYNGYVIEFQHSPMSSAEFDERNEFYTSAGYKVIWVFDLRSKVYHRKIKYNKDTSKNGFYKTLYNWSNRIHTFDNFYPQYNKNIIVFFQFTNSDSEEAYYEEFNDEYYEDLDDYYDFEDDYDKDFCMLNRVVWAIDDEDAEYSNFKRFYVQHQFNFEFEPNFLTAFPADDEDFINALKKKKI